MLEEKLISCPYCGEDITILVEPMIADGTDSAEGIFGGEMQNYRYIEDCQVCCRPITIHVSIEHGGGSSVDVYHENE